MEVGEISFPSGYAWRSPTIYLEGTLEHAVNGKPHRLTRGMVGIVRPEDTVIHNVIGETAVKAVVIWAPGGEVERLRGAFPAERILLDQ